MSVNCYSEINGSDQPLIEGILLAKGIIAGGAVIPFVGQQMNVYQPLGAFFKDIGLINLYGYAMELDPL